MKARIKPEGVINHNQYHNVFKDAKARCSEDIMQYLGNNMDAMILYTLYQNFGFTEEKLRKFHRTFILNTKFLGKRFAMEEEPSYIAEEILKECKINLPLWLEEDLKTWDAIVNKDMERWTLEEFNDFCEELGEKVKR